LGWSGKKKKSIRNRLIQRWGGDAFFGRTRRGGEKGGGGETNTLKNRGRGRERKCLSTLFRGGKKRAAVYTGLTLGRRETAAK